MEGGVAPPFFFFLFFLRRLHISSTIVFFQSLMMRWYKVWTFMRNKEEERYNIEYIITIKSIGCSKIVRYSPLALICILSWVSSPISQSFYLIIVLNLTLVVAFWTPSGNLSHPLPWKHFQKFTAISCNLRHSTIVFITFLNTKWSPLPYGRSPFPCTSWLCLYYMWPSTTK